MEVRHIPLALLGALLHAAAGIAIAPRLESNSPVVALMLSLACIAMVNTPCGMSIIG
jgi:hypothetical protein